MEGIAQRETTVSISTQSPSEHTSSPFALLDHLLLLPDKADIERDAVAHAWQAHGGRVRRLGKFWQPSALDSARVCLYGNDTFCLVIAQKLGLQLVSPDDAILMQCPPQLLQREVHLRELGTLGTRDFPLFVKSLVPKLFRSAVYDTLATLERQCQGLEASTAVLTSEVVHFVAEARSFIHQRQVLDCAIYEDQADLQDARSCVEALVRSLPLPETCVLDVGLIEGKGWAFLEANASWGAGLNGCDPTKVLPAIKAATFYRS